MFDIIAGNCRGKCNGCPQQLSGCNPTALEGNEILKIVAPGLSGLGNTSNMMLDLNILRRKINDAMISYQKGDSRFVVNLPDEEIDRYVNYGINKELLYRISTPVYVDKDDQLPIESANQVHTNIDYENAMKVAAAKRVLEQANALENYGAIREEQDKSDDNSMLFIILILAITGIIIYKESKK